MNPMARLSRAGDPGRRFSRCPTLDLRRYGLVWSVLFLVVFCGCANRFRNTPLDTFDLTRGYRFETLRPGEGNTDGLFVFLAFSGGGTRASSLAYGVLQGLAEIELPGLSEGDPKRSLLDEVDMISSVSGGSFTAMGYALWRERLFDGRFKKKYLTHNVQRDLLFHVLNPLNLLALPLPLVDSIDIASSYYDRNIFDRQTFGDLMRRGTRPFVLINATDMARQKTFQFIQDDFDILGSDLATLPVGWAVGASSAYPILLSPMRLVYYPGEPMHAAVAEELASPSVLMLPNRRDWAKSLLTESSESDGGRFEIDTRNHRFLYLIDGGLSDNLGLQAFVEAYQEGVIRQGIDAGKIRRLLVIIVDAGTEPNSSIEKSISAPGRLFQGLTAASAGIYNNSAIMTGALNYLLLTAHQRTQRAYEACRTAMAKDGLASKAPTAPPEIQLDSYVAGINFRNINDRDHKKRFMSIITSFVLPVHDVDSLIEEGRKQVCNHAEIKRLIQDMGA